MWHSAAHVLGAALQAYFGDDVLLCDGPPQREDSSTGGFFYEMFIQGDVRLSDAFNPDLLRLARGLVKDKQRFQRLQVDRDAARALFAGNRFKLGLIDSIPAGDPITVYRCGDFLDLCRGPHVPHTGLLKVRFPQGAGISLAAQHVGGGMSPCFLVPRVTRAASLMCTLLAGLCPHHVLGVSP
jgi:threonyl-tRNA synthetase